MTMSDQFDSQQASCKLIRFFMKRFILYSLSATVALTFGTVARAGIYENSDEMDRNPTEGVISPDSNEPNNRAIPESGVNGESSTVSESEVLTEGIIVPNSNEPSNRAMPDRGALNYDAPSEADTAPTEGVIVPSDNEPSNRTVPNEGVDSRDAENGYDEVYQEYRETPNVNDGYPSDREMTNPAPTDGVISPDGNSPNNRAVPNRAVPQEGAPEPNDTMTEPQDTAPTDGIIVPDSNEPSNRTDVEDDATPPRFEDDTTRQEEMAPNEGIIVPDRDSPNNREVPGTVR